MSRHNKLSKSKYRWRRLVYDGIELIPVDTRRFGYADKKNCWHLPGGEIAETRTMVRRATSRGLTIVLQEFDGAKVAAVSLI